MQRNVSNMTDQQMLEHALEIYPDDWTQIAIYERQAKDSDVKKRLHSLAVSGYHYEEGCVGIL